MNNLNEKLKQLRIDGKFTQQQIADHLFVSRQAVSNWENGKNIPDLSTIILLSKFYGVSLDTLLKGEKEVIKSMKKELDSINASDLTGIVLMIILSFVLPVFGLVIAVYVLKKSKDPAYPKWAKVLALLAIAFQICLILYVGLAIFFFSFTTMETTGSQEILLKH